MGGEDLGYETSMSSGAGGCFASRRGREAAWRQWGRRGGGEVEWGGYEQDIRDGDGTWDTYGDCMGMGMRWSMGMSMSTTH